MASTTSAAPSPTASSSDSGGGPSSPLLFFVALGFGVVFTNLWIIVGVKYCFRYNQRNRARMAGEDPDAMDMAQMPRQRRRREKKLMTIDEVNEKFPLTKYKTWRSNRADQGLPTAGGITNAASRPASIKNVVTDSEAIEKNHSSPTTSTVNEKTESTIEVQPEHARPEIIRLDTVEPSASEASPVGKSTIAAPEPALVKTNTADDTEADQIETAIPAEQLPDPGDTCAICIDTIEDDDDVRGLSCGHAFHASCVDPWLTSRRACCPLCKADYYVPKPRPEGQEGSRSRQPLPPTPFQLITGARQGYRRARTPGIVPGVFFSHAHHGRPQARNSDRRSARISTVTISENPEVTEAAQPNTWRGRLPNVRLPSMPALSMIRRGRGNEAGAQPQETGTVPTPAQLESGHR